MSRKIIFPSGEDLINYLNRGDAICNKCGALMDRESDPDGYCDVFVCPSCKWRIDTSDYEYEGYDEDDIPGMPPAGCRACGGPYPYCMTSCKLFDD